MNIYNFKSSFVQYTLFKISVCKIAQTRTNIGSLLELFLFPMDCAVHCFREFCCRSANFRNIPVSDGRGNCELFHAICRRGAWEVENKRYLWLSGGWTRRSKKNIEMVKCVSITIWKTWEGSSPSEILLRSFMPQ